MVRLPRCRSFRPRVECLERRTVPTTLYGLTDSNSLLRFDSATPGTINAATPITGLQTNERMAGIDFRPRTGQLFGVGVVDLASDIIRTYTINPLTGVATRVGSTVFLVTDGNFYGVAFDPTADQIRVVNDADANFRINPDTGARADDPTNDVPVNNGGNHIREIAFDRSFDTGLAVASRTTLFAIVTQSSGLGTIGGINQDPSPNNFPNLSNLHSLGIVVVPVSPVGFDIPAGSSTGFATLQDAATHLTRLYSINLGTSAATLVGTVGDGAAQVVGMAAAPASSLIAGSGAGVKARVRVFDGATGALRFGLLPYGNFQGGVRVAAGDVNGDGVPDIIVAPGPGAARPVRVFSGIDGSPLSGFFPFGTNFKSGIYVAAGDVNGDGKKDVIVGADAGGKARLKVFSGADGSELSSAFPATALFPFGMAFKGGLRVAAADFNNDGRSEIVVASGAGKRSQVKVLDGSGNLFISALTPSFFPYGQLKLGLFVAAGDVNGDGIPDIITGNGAGGAPSVRIISGVNGALLGNFHAYESTFAGGVMVGLADINGDGRYDIRTGPGAGRAALVRAFDGLTLALVGNFAAFPGFQGGVFVSGARA